MVEPEPIQEAPFNVIIPKPFVLAEQDTDALMQIRDEIMDKVKTWESRSSGFFLEHEIYSESWRVKPRFTNVKKPMGLFNSKSGETHRAVETLATIWLRMLTAQDQFFEGIAQGLNDQGEELSDVDLYSAETVLLRQLQWGHFKEKLLRSLRSLALMGTAIFEEPVVSLPYGDGRKTKEYTDLVLRNLLQTGFDTGVFDIELSDYIFTVDFPTKWRLLNWSRADNEVWDREGLARILSETSPAAALKNMTSVYNRLVESKQRAGYNDIDKNIHEFINYHGRLETENSVIAALWESQGRQDDPSFKDFSVGLLNGDNVVKFHVEQFGTWHSRFKVAHFKLFEHEPLGYGVGKIGRKAQREQDITKSRINDLLTFGLYSMWKVGKFAGLKAGQLNISPHLLVELDDISQLERIGIDIQAIQQGIQLINLDKEDFRTTVGAATNLQAQVTKASATESAIAQNEAIRGASVHAEIIAETFLREHLETMHLNNLTYLDEPIWVGATGERKGQFYDRNNLPVNVGFIVKVVTDKDFRPERAAKLLEGINISSSVRNLVPSAVNVVVPLFEEWFRTMGMNPRLLKQPIPVQQQMEQSLKNANIGGGVKNEVEGEAESLAAGGGGNVTQTPVGPVETSPLNPSIVPGV